jgi:acetolactate synthase-1/2/3 large subunit
LDYVKLCAAYEIPARRVTNLSELKCALDERIITPGPFLIEVLIAPDEDVYPIVPPGKSIDEYMLKKE